MPTYMDELIEQMKNKKSKAIQQQSQPEEPAKQIKDPFEKKEIKIEPEKKFDKETMQKLEEKLKGLSIKKETKKEAPNPQEIVQPESMVSKYQSAEAEIKNWKLIDSYGDTKIYRIPNEDLLMYYASTINATASEKTIINTIKEAATRIITVSPYRIRDPQERKNAYFQKIMEILQNSPQLKISSRRFEFYAEAVVREMVGFGLIDPMINDDQIEEIMVIGSKKPVYVFHRKYDMMTSNIEFYSDQEIVDLVNKIARQVGRRVDISSPMLDARLADGSRVNSTIPPASVDGSTLTIRKFKKDPFTIIDLITNGTVNSYLAAFFWGAVDGFREKPANILISGGTGSGKTTTLNSLAAFIPPYERIITIEDTAELSLPLKHWIRLEGRPPSLEGKGEITLDILTKNSLRMRPDRILVGEIRHQEAFTLFTAINTGHEGCMGTVHANSALETVVRVSSPPMNVPEVMFAGLDLITIEHRFHDKRKGTLRRITEVAEVTGALEGKVKTNTIFEYDRATDTIKRTKKESEYLKKIANFMGKTPEHVEKIILKREKFLNELKDQEVRGIEKVTEKCLEYIETENLGQDKNG